MVMKSYNQMESLKIIFAVFIFIIYLVIFHKSNMLCGQKNITVKEKTGDLFKILPCLRMT